MKGINKYNKGEAKIHAKKGYQNSKLNIQLLQALNKVV